jgi:hypothetical protein
MADAVLIFLEWLPNKVYSGNHNFEKASSVMKFVRFL